MTYLILAADIATQLAEFAICGLAGAATVVLLVKAVSAIDALNIEGRIS